MIMIAQRIRNIFSVEIGQLNRKCLNMPSQVYDRRFLVRYKIKILNEFTYYLNTWHIFLNYVQYLN